MKTFGAWDVSRSEYLAALSLSIENDPLGNAAYQLVRYCKGETFQRGPAAEALRIIRGEPSETAAHN